MLHSNFAVLLFLLCLVGLSSSNYYRSHRPRPQQNQWQQQRQMSRQPPVQETRLRTYNPQSNGDYSSRGQIRQRDTEDQGKDN